MEQKQAFEFLGITAFHKAGYTGSRVKVMSDEKILKEYKNIKNWDKVICPKGYQSNESKWHGSSVMKILLEVAPDATFYAYPFDVSLTKSNCAEFIKENNIHLFTSSCTGAAVSKNKAKHIQECIDSGCTFFIAAGNETDKGLRAESKSELYLAIGIADMVGGKVKWVSPSSIGPELDFMALSIWDRWTSWGCPTFCAMCALVQDFFIAKTGKALHKDKLIEFIHDNTIDIESEGFDIKSGYGLFKLPNPESIDISKYVPEYSTGSNHIAFKEEHISTTPAIKKYKVCIDPGHGGSDPGAVSSKLYEKDVNLEIGLAMRDFLQPYVDVVMTRSTDITLSLEERVRIANEANVDFFFSIHCNSAENTAAKGWECYIISKGGKAEKLAIRAQAHVFDEATLSLKDRGIKTANFYVLRETDAPAVIVENAFISNTDDRTNILKSKAALNYLAVCYSNAICDMCGIRFDLDETTEENITPFDWSLTVLEANGVISNAEYWRNNKDKIQYLEQLIINMSNYIEKNK